MQTIKSEHIMILPIYAENYKHLVNGDGETYIFSLPYAMPCFMCSNIKLHKNITEVHFSITKETLDFYNGEEKIFTFTRDDIIYHKSKEAKLIIDIALDLVY